MSETLLKRSGRKLSNSDWVLTLRDWHQRSLTFLDPRKTFDDYLAAFLAKPAKVRIPTGEGDVLNKALEAVSKLQVPELPVIHGLSDALGHPVRRDRRLIHKLLLPAYHPQNLLHAEVFPKKPQFR